ncbi:MAG: hypothetical protein ACI88H_000643, partial [Cocleimonas sp.]
DNFKGFNVTSVVFNFNRGTKKHFAFLLWCVIDNFEFGQQFA